MKIGHNSVVAFDYTLTNDTGEVLDKSEPGEPLVYLHGHEQIVPGLEAALAGKEPGERVVAIVSPVDGYGEKSGDPDMQVPVSALPQDVTIEEGMVLDAQSPDGEQVTLWVTQVTTEHVHVTPDHPLAGVTLHFDVTVKDVREATKDELSHGHVHGPGGAH